MTNRPAQPARPADPRVDGFVQFRPAADAGADRALSPEDLALAPVTWLLTRGHDRAGTGGLIRGLCELLRHQGVPLWRATCFVRTLHPQTSGNNVIWRRDSDSVDDVTLLRGIETTEPFRRSPLPAIFEGAGAVRRRLDDPRIRLDFPILADLRAEGATDYVAMPLVFSDGEINCVTWASDWPGGFTAADLARLDELLPALSLRCEVLERQRMTRLLLQTYLGGDAGRRVLRGTIERGQGDTIHAAIWYSDLRGFTSLSDSLSGERIIALLNEYFECVAVPIEERGGDILKFIGDGVLAIFPLTGRSEAEACAAALKAAADTGTLLRHLNRRRERAGQTVIRHGIGLHIGAVHYGNIGAPERLDFTVIGPAVNLASRLQDLCKRTGEPVVASAAFAAASGAGLIPAGEYAVRGLTAPVAIYRPPDCA